MNNYSNRLRLMIKLRNDEAYTVADAKSAFISIHSSEAEKGAVISASKDNRYSPAIHITYFKY